MTARFILIYLVGDEVELLGAFPTEDSARDKMLERAQLLVRAEVGDNRMAESQVVSTGEIQRDGLYYIQFDREVLLYRHTTQAGWILSSRSATLAGRLLIRELPEDNTREIDRDARALVHTIPIAHTGNITVYMDELKGRLAIIREATDGTDDVPETNEL